MKINKILLSTLLLTNCVFAHAADKKITISNAATYYDEKIIQSNIRSECGTLGAQFSQNTKINLEKNGWAVALSENPQNLNEGTQLKLMISNALSDGNSFIGHHKSVSIIAELYKDGKLIDTFNTTRNSGGGFGAGFKNSCSVLERCVTTLGKDVAQWLKSKS